MVNILACARARESAEAWLAERKASLPTPPRVSAAFAETAMVDAFAAGWGQADEAFADERQIGQRQLDDATALMRETAELLRGYEKHHRERAEGYRQEANQAFGHRKDAAREDWRGSTMKAARNALAAARLEAWLRGEARYPTSLCAHERTVEHETGDGISVTFCPECGRSIAINGVPLGDNPAEVLREVASDLAADLGLGVDHASFDAAAAKLDEEGKALTIYRLGESVDLVRAMAGVALIEEGAGWVKVHGVPDVRALFNVLRLARFAADAGQPDGENPEAGEDWFKRARLIMPGEPPAEAPWRKEGVADLTAFRLTTGDPRFDPTKPVSVNGFTYHPATKED